MTQVIPKNRAREYETIFILHPDSRTDVVDAVAARCQDVLTRLDGKLLKAENWGRRRLAYPVQKNAKGIYIYLHYLGYSELVHELERNLRVMDSVIKFMTVKVDVDVDPEARPVTEADISFAAKFDDLAPEAPVTDDVTAEEASAEKTEDSEESEESEESKDVVDNNDDNSDADDDSDAEEK